MELKTIKDWKTFLKTRKNDYYDTWGEKVYSTPACYVKTKTLYATYTMVEVVSTPMPKASIVARLATERDIIRGDYYICTYSNGNFEIGNGSITNFNSENKNIHFFTTKKEALDYCKAYKNSAVTKENLKHAVRSKMYDINTNMKKITANYQAMLTEQANFKEFCKNY